MGDSIDVNDSTTTGFLTSSTFLGSSTFATIPSSSILSTAARSTRESILRLLALDKLLALNGVTLVPSSLVPSITLGVGNATGSTGEIVGEVGEWGTSGVEGRERRWTRAESPPISLLLVLFLRGWTGMSRDDVGVVEGGEEDSGVGEGLLRERGWVSLSALTSSTTSAGTTAKISCALIIVVAATFVLALGTGGPGKVLSPLPSSANLSTPIFGNVPA